tara:strand:- start:2471 stop:2731 length:261 start_codon:yes stop_codon:yes gene_type:complete
MSEKRIKKMEEKLESLSPNYIRIEDEGHLHVGHAGAKKGGHFKLIISGECFDGLSTIECHKLIYKTLGDLMVTEIHALSISIKKEG